MILFRLEFICNLYSGKWLQIYFFINSFVHVETFTIYNNEVGVKFTIWIECSALSAIEFHRSSYFS